jgi:ankyrin repeat protein
MLFRLTLVFLFTALFAQAAFGDINSDIVTDEDASREDPEMEKHIQSALTIRGLSTAVESFKIDNYGYAPYAEDSKSLIEKMIELDYLPHEFPDTDGWGNVIGYRVSKDLKSYTIASGGADGDGKNFNFDDMSKVSARNSFEWNCDILLRDGQFRFGECGVETIPVTISYENCLESCLKQYNDCIAKGNTPEYCEGHQRECKKACAEVVKTLLDADADVNAKDKSGVTALMVAACAGHTEMVETLLDAGADVNAKGEVGFTALMFAAQEGHTEIVEILKQAGATAYGVINLDLLEAAKAGDAAEVEKLLEQGADVNAKGKYGMTALMVAVEGGHTETVKALIDAGADVNAKNIDGWTAWTALMWAVMEGHTEIVKVLIESGAEVNARENITDETALIKAASGGHAEMVKVLMDAGADVNAKNKDGITALMLAAKDGHTEIVEILIQAGAKE